MLLTEPPGPDAPARTEPPAPAPARPAPVAALIRPVDPRHAPDIEMFNVKTGKSFTLRLYTPEGALRWGALTELREFLVDPRNHEDHPIHWRLATVVVAVAAHFPGKRIRVISGYRHASRHTKRSRHTRGRALDFKVEGVDNRRLRDLVRRSFNGVGVGYYPNSTFIHVDVRERDGQWIDYAGPGQDACYSPNVAGDFASGVSETLSYEAAIERGCRHVPGKPAPPKPKAKRTTPPKTSSASPR